MIIQGYQCLVNLLGAYLELRECCFRPRAGIFQSLPGANTPAVENRSSRPVCAESHKTKHKSNVLSRIPTCPECLKALPLRGRACSKRKEQNNGNSRKVQAVLGSAAQSHSRLEAFPCLTPWFSMAWLLSLLEFLNWNYPTTYYCSFQTTFPGSHPAFLCSQ